MLLDSNDYKYEYFHQPRGQDGDSGVIYMGIPKKNGLCQILVKSFDPADAINEFIGCNVGKRIGVNTPGAWLFKPCLAEFDDIHFGQAVAIEYIDGLNDEGENCYVTEEAASQTIKCIFLHKLMFERDGISYGKVGDNVYTFDFAEAMLPQFLPNKNDARKLENGFTRYEWMLMRWEHDTQREMFSYLQKLKKEGKYGNMAADIYMDMREKYIERYNAGGFSDLVEDVAMAYNSLATELATEMLDAMQQSLIGF